MGTRARNRPLPKRRGPTDVTSFLPGRAARLGEQWEPLLTAFVSLARATQRKGTKEDVPSFYRRLEAAHHRCHRRSVEPLLNVLLETRQHAEELVARAAREDGVTTADLDPLATLLPLNIVYWYRELGGRFRLLHDEHPLLKAQFVQNMLGVLWYPHPDLADISPRARLGTFATGASSKHSSIQLADLAAGAGRVVVAAHLAEPSKAADLLAESVKPLVTWVCYLMTASGNQR